MKDTVGGRDNNSDMFEEINSADDSLSTVEEK
jgi:hypothetical protein